MFRNKAFRHHAGVSLPIMGTWSHGPDGGGWCNDPTNGDMV